MVDLSFYAVTYYELAQPPLTDLRLHARWNRENLTSPGEPHPSWKRLGEMSLCGWTCQNRDRWIGRPRTESIFSVRAGTQHAGGAGTHLIDGEDDAVRVEHRHRGLLQRRLVLLSTFSAPTHGCMFCTQLAGRASACRFHVTIDAVLPSRSGATMDHGIANEIVADYASAAYRYQAEPHQLLRLPSVEQRRPTSAAANVAQSLVVLARRPRPGSGAYDGWPDAVTPGVHSSRRRWAGHVSALLYRFTVCADHPTPSTSICSRFLGDRVPAARVMDCGCGPGRIEYAELLRWSEAICSP